MQHIMTDVLLQDPLPPNKNPLYLIDGNCKIIYLARDEDNDICRHHFRSPSEQPATQILLPMLALKQPWKHHSWKNKTPRDLKNMVSRLLVSGGIYTDNQHRASSAEEAFEYARNWYAERQLLPGHIAGNSDTLFAHHELITEYGLFRRDVQINRSTNDWARCFNGELVFFPDPEYAGALSIEHGDGKIGMFLILNNVLRIIIKTDSNQI
jgi:hypothetical protein